MCRRTRFWRVNEMEAMYEVSCMTVKFERGSTCTFTCDLSCIASIYIYARSLVKITRQWKSLRLRGKNTIYQQKLCVFNSAGRERGRLDSEDYRMCIVNLMLGI